MAASIGAPVGVTDRIPGLDLLRGLSLVMMLVHHFTSWLGGEPRDVIPGWPGFAVTDVAAPAFAVTAGASLALLVERMDRRNAPPGQVTRVVLRRYGLLVPIGMALTLVALGDPLYFGVLEALGVSALVAYATLRAARRASTRWLIALTLFALAAPLARLADAFEPVPYLPNIVAGPFPLAQYAGFALVGALAVRPVSRLGASQVVVLAGALLAVATLAALFGAPPDRHPPGPAYTLPGLAGTAALYALLTAWRVPAPADRALAVAGRRSLGIFVGHYGLYVVLGATGTRDAMATELALVVAVLLTAAVVAAALVLPPLPFSLRRPRRRTDGGAGDEDPREAEGVAPTVAV